MMPKSELAHSPTFHVSRASLAAAALDRACDAIAIFTAHESPVGAQIVYVNAAYERLSGYSAAQLLGHSSVLLAGARPDLDHVRELEASSREAPYETVTRKYRPDGTAYVVELRVAPLWERERGDESEEGEEQNAQKRQNAGDGVVTHMILTQRDITAQRARSGTDATELLRAETAAVDRLAAGAAYELEGPLARIGVSLRAALVAGFADGEPELLSDLNEAVRATEEIEATVRGLRAFGAVEDATHGVDVHEAIELAAHFTRGELAQRATLRRQYAAAPRAHGSLPRLTRVLIALFRNAAAAIPRSTPWANNVVVQTGLTREGLVSVDVSDTGTGIEPEDLPFVFDPFFTTKPTPASPGLGLASARAAVLEMGGTLTVESTVGRGSRFRILLPAAESVGSSLLHFLETEEPRARRALCVAESAAEARRLRDLVDDGEAHLVFATCAEALERLSLGEDYDLVFCDASASARFGFREQLARLAPRALTRTFALAMRSSVSGTFSLADTPLRVPRVAGGGGQ
jgi:PAS domain S-box-containing protein